MINSSHLLFGSLILILVLAVIFVFTTSATPDSVRKCNGCVADLQTGNKTCPTDGNELVYDTAIQECVSNTCPVYYILSDGSTATECPEGELCGCSSTKRCARWVASAIDTDSENYNQISLYDLDQRGPTLEIPNNYSCTGPENSMFPMKVCRRGTPAKLSNGDFACVLGYPVPCSGDLLYDEMTGELSCGDGKVEDDRT